MTDELDDLKTRLKVAEVHNTPEQPTDLPPTRGMGQAMQLAIDLVAAVGISLFLGILIDKNLGTKPWFTLIFLIIGVAAGFRNFYVFARKLLRPDNKD